MIEPLGADEARVDGRAAIEDLLEHFDLPTDAVEDPEEYDTVGGLIYHRIGGVPKVGDEVRIGDALRLTVETTDGRRVGKIMVQRSRPSVEDPATDDD